MGEKQQKIKSNKKSFNYLSGACSQFWGLCFFTFSKIKKMPAGALFWGGYFFGCFDDWQGDFILGGHT